MSTLNMFLVTSNLRYFFTEITFPWLSQSKVCLLTRAIVSRFQFSKMLKQFEVGIEQTSRLEVSLSTPLVDLDDDGGVGVGEADDEDGCCPDHGLKMDSGF